MSKVILVKTDDPMKRQFRLVVKGPVEPVVDIVPTSVYLEGRPGDQLSQELLVTPSSKYPFSILGVRLKNNTPIQVKLETPENGGRSWRVDITARSEKADSLYEILELTTDSKLKPLISIRVYMVFIDKPAKKKKTPEKS